MPRARSQKAAVETDRGGRASPNNSDAAVGSGKTLLCLLDAHQLPRDFQGRMSTRFGFARIKRKALLKSPPALPGGLRLSARVARTIGLLMPVPSPPPDGQRIRTAYKTGSSCVHHSRSPASRGAHTSMRWWGVGDTRKGGGLRLSFEPLGWRQIGYSSLSSTPTRRNGRQCSRLRPEAW